MTPLVLVILALAAFRVVRLLTRDTLTEPIRRRTIDKLDPDSYLGDLLTCTWCLGVWVSGGWYAWWRVHPSSALAVATPLALASLVGITAKNLDL